MLSFPLRSVFLAIPLDDTAAEAFVQAQSFISGSIEGLRLQPASTPHLTLCFWHQVTDERTLRDVRDMAAAVASSTSPFDVDLGGASLFGADGHEHTIYLSVRPCPALFRLQSRFSSMDSRPFHPHVTIARIKDPSLFRPHRDRILRALADTLFSLHADRLSLYANVQGTPQTRLEEFHFDSTQSSSF